VARIYHEFWGKDTYFFKWLELMQYNREFIKDLIEEISARNEMDETASEVRQGLVHPPRQSLPDMIHALFGRT
jgi:hypothetical protein